MGTYISRLGASILYWVILHRIPRLALERICVSVFLIRVNLRTYFFNYHFRGQAAVLYSTAKILSSCVGILGISTSVCLP